MKEKATGFEALKGVGAPLKELIDKKGKSFSGFGELKDLGPGFQTLKSLTDRPDDKGKKPGPPKPIAEIKKEEGAGKAADYEGYSGTPYYQGKTG